MDVIGGCPACGKSARVNHYGDITCSCGTGPGLIAALIFSAVVVFALVAAAGCVERETTAEPIYISCTDQIHRVELKWAKAVKDCRSKLTVCEMLADEECVK